MSYREQFKGKKITVMGLGLLGRSVGDAAFLAECGAELIVTDLKGKEDLAESFNRLKDFPNIEFVFGEHREEDFQNSDMVLVAAGVPMDSPYLKRARENDVELAMSGALFAKLSGIPIIGVTGTRGKSTVTHMIHHTLEVATGEEVILGGNIRGVSNLQLLKEVHEGSLAVMELDSWQLQGFGWAGISPQIAVFTNFMDDHLNYYHGDRDAYFADKANIFLNQEEGGVLVTTAAVFDRAKEFAKGREVSLAGEVILADESSLPEDVVLGMPGEHNRQNAALAYEALRALSLNEEHIAEGFATFSGVPGRLEYLGERKGVKVYNDNNATTPSATLAGLRAVASGTNVVLIMGGADKELELRELIEHLPEYAKEVILLPGTGTDRLIAEGTDLPFKWKVTEGIEGALEAAFAAGERGDVLLFSPGFASFGHFTNEYDRNDQFVAAAGKIIESAIEA